MRIAALALIMVVAISAAWLAPVQHASAVDTPEAAGVCIQPGERTIVRVTFESLHALHVEPGSTPVTVAHSEVSGHPEISVAHQTLPPTWVWPADAGAVTVNIPVTVPTDTEPGRYELTLHATHEPPLYDEGSPTEYQVPVFVGACP